MTDRDETPAPIPAPASADADTDAGIGDGDDPTATSADALFDAVAGLGETPEDQLDTVAERNTSLEERLPGDDHSGGASRSPDQG
ncbi:hypothetical protein ACFVU2_07640 [Leifsonia sp. NPDC058194]|uniref:hypothetical protein n=1 Tax=Leifsonia sp. NPDC058194 TaxID=3346374 RepID=UPI0036DB43A9